MKIPAGDQLLNPEYILKNELQIKPGDRVADLGCGGQGYFSLQAAKLVTDTGQIHAVDILKESLKSVQTSAKIAGLINLITHWSNLEKFGALKITDQSLDVVLLINVLYQNNDKKTILKEAARLLKPEGRLLVIDWTPGRFSIGPQPDEKASPEELVSIATKLGLSQVKSFEAGKYHYGLVFQKS